MKKILLLIALSTASVSRSGELTGSFMGPSINLSKQSPDLSSKFSFAPVIDIKYDFRPKGSDGLSLIANGAILFKEKANFYAAGIGPKYRINLSDNWSLDLSATLGAGYQDNQELAYEKRPSSAAVFKHIDYLTKLNNKKGFGPNMREDLFRINPKTESLNNYLSTPNLSYSDISITIYINSKPELINSPEIVKVYKDLERTKFVVIETRSPYEPKISESEVEDFIKKIKPKFDEYIDKNGPVSMFYMSEIRSFLEKNYVPDDIAIKALSDVKDAMSFDSLEKFKALIKEEMQKSGYTNNDFKIMPFVKFELAAQYSIDDNISLGMNFNYIPKNLGTELDVEHNLYMGGYLSFKF